VATLELTEEETDVLRTILENDFGDLRMEIANTDSADFRDMLKEREAVIKRLILSLGGSIE
jgi:hypothetical protein